MDPSKPVRYRGLNVNTVTLESGRTLRGIAIEDIDYSNVDVVGYTEKRAGADGVHASDVTYGARLIEINGTVYGTSVAEAFDFLHILRSVFSATSAYTESPGDRGFLPLEFSEPTLDDQSFPGGVKDLLLYARGRSSVRFRINRDRLVSTPRGKPVAIQFGVVLWAKDPRVYVNPSQIVDISGSVHSNVAGHAVNRGDYETPLNVLIAKATAPADANQYVRITGLNGVDMKIKLLAEPNRVYRWYGDDRVLKVQDTSGGPSAPEVLRMDLVSFATKQRRPGVPALINPPQRPFSSSFNYWTTVALDAGSRLFWSEAFA